MKNHVEIALALAARGWPVFPTGANKRPIIKDWPNRASTDEATIRAMWAQYPQAPVAIVTGRRSGLFVVDVDKEGGHPIHDRLDPTMLVGTPRGGAHYYYRMPDGLDDDDVLRNTQKADKCLGYGDVDTRGNGGYVLAPGSVVGDGRQYEILVDVEPAPIPAWVLDAMRSYKRASVQAQRALVLPSARIGDRDTAMRRARAYVARMPGAISGAGGHSSTMAVARACATGFGLDVGDVLEVLREFNLRCTPPWSDRELEHKAREASTKPDPKGNAPGHLLSSSSLDDPFHGAEIHGDASLALVPDDVDDGEVQTTTSGAPRKAPRSFRRLPDRDDADTWRIYDEVRALGGLCDAFPAWVMAGAEYPQPGLAIGALIALGSAICGRRWVYERATSAQIVCAVADTAHGKGRPQGALTQALERSWAALVGANDLSSTVSTLARIEQATLEGHGLLLVLDEYGPRLKALFDSRSGHQRETRGLLLDLTTKGTGTYRAATSVARGGADRVLVAPSLSIMGSSTPSALHDAVGQLAIDDGFMGRHFWVEALSVLPKRQRPAPTARDVPAAVASAIDGWRVEHEEWVRANPHGDTKAGDAIRVYVPDEVQDAGGAVILADYADHLDDRRRTPLAGDVPPALLGRCAEQATRLALVLAVLRQQPGSWPVVGEDVAWTAIALVEASSAIVARSLRDHSAPRWDDEAGQVAAVEAAIMAHADADGWATRTDVLRACRKLSADAVDRACRRLLEEERLETAKRASKGRAATVLRLVD